MRTIYYGSATFLFRPTDLMNPSNKQFSGSCPTHRYATSKEQALDICKEDAESKAGSEYEYESVLAENIEHKEFDV
jgi:hypothetical protein